MIDPPTVFRRFRREEPKLPSSGFHTGLDLFKRYPGVCRVYAIIGLVFEQIPEYCGRLRPFFDFLSLFCRKILGFKKSKLISFPTILYQKS